MATTNLPEWYYELCDRTQAVGIAASSQPHRVSKPDIFSGSQQRKKKSRADEDGLKVKRAWEIALAPVKSLPMNLIMSWFSGNSMQIVTMSMTFYMFFMSPFRQILSVGQTFDHLDGKNVHSEILVTKIVFILCALVTMGAGIWKVGQMGLLPTHTSDWLAWQEPSTYSASF